ncbi:cobyric acid synthase [Pelagibacterium halotolerans]|uniref:Cobyric acid synthase n=1 Tax=Pelagibacterium halotolerans (strain DSM 22347 / JCM 15775 / CGMCC 1.7692 / B2) TaxID=1082931 RepID=G4REJ3_PELHB|nr:cobyric acid synthase [Pelagibacterium halotolerans]AEQ53925.1 cobyric acid synthase [Pelagibacterium halotolerans B2]QJR19934.1 cobyric acid synthase [Pelagibacterium halotolerans]SEA46719.1 adenosylcobyric acid synthase (glutamine-hydrolysing) [Pelagibacterium halotolerans]
MTRAIMVMGTGSDVGKSLIVAGLCRAFANRGLSVAPFKPQNMSNNAAVTSDGGEIGRAQALQAKAARKEPVTAMNPVLLKPEKDTGSQVVIRGKRVASMSARDYFRNRSRFMPAVLDAFNLLAAQSDLVIVEGAGSASEINLREGDIANFGFAQELTIPVILVGDIHRGGVIASLAGTFAVIDRADADLIAATLVNKFHGDPTLFDTGRAIIETHTARPCLGVVPHFAHASRLPAEDVLAIENIEQNPGKTVIAVPRLGRIANFDDLDPLRAEPGVSLVIVQPGQPIPRDAKLVILPGSKATRADLDLFRALGWDIDLAAHIRAGGHVLGVCGGYQMLGTSVADPDGVEGKPGQTQGLGHLDIATRLEGVKQLRLETATDAASGLPLTGYHMHMGATSGPDTARPFAHVDGVPEGARSADGKIMGTYLHGLFAADAFRRQFLANLDISIDPLLDFDRLIDQTLDDLAAHLETHLDLDAILALAREPQS